MITTNNKTWPVTKDWTLILSQDDCAPDSLETFLKKFKDLFEISFSEFIERSEKISLDDGFCNCYLLNGIEVSISADYPFYEVREDPFFNS